MLNVVSLIAVKKVNGTNPKMTAFQTIMLFSDGAPLTPAGGSSWRLKTSSPKKLQYKTDQQYHMYITKS